MKIILFIYIDIYQYNNNKYSICLSIPTSKLNGFELNILCAYTNSNFINCLNNNQGICIAT